MFWLAACSGDSVLQARDTKIVSVVLTIKTELRSCVKVEVAVLGSPSLTTLTVSVDVKQHWTVLRHWSQFVPNMSTDVRGHEALHHYHLYFRIAQELYGSLGVCPGLPPLITLLFLWTESNTSSSSSSTIKEKKNRNYPELRSCVKVEVAVLGSTSLISRRFLWT